MITVGLDMSLSASGLCILSDTAPIILRTIPGNGKNQKQRRQHIITKILDAIAESERPAMICIEQALMHSKNMQGATQQITLTECMGDEVIDAGLPLWRIAQSTLKKYATGNGHAEKPDMVAAAHRAGANAADDNQADAYWLARIADGICRVRACERLDPMRQEAIENLLYPKAKTRRKPSRKSGAVRNHRKHPETGVVM